ncbi:hypothetical protein HZH66_006765 [Vespula vulgaris]|uniref:Uncharacterized protein n=1 Tax=Vespula vulgaris TaxID=7454 RepID=A0A834N934_VESVU|nr:hypothetical protein HZH66_006765 [Vespula vulgaris]
MSTAPMRLLETWKLSRRHSWSTKQVYDMVRLSSVPVSERFLRTVRPQLCKALPGRINQSPPWRPDSSKFVASFQPSSVWIGIPLACGLQRSRPGAVYLPAGFLIRFSDTVTLFGQEVEGSPNNDLCKFVPEFDNWIPLVSQAYPKIFGFALSVSMFLTYRVPTGLREFKASSAFNVVALLSTRQSNAWMLERRSGNVTSKAVL